MQIRKHMHEDKKGIDFLETHGDVLFIIHSVYVFCPTLTNTREELCKCDARKTLLDQNTPHL